MFIKESKILIADGTKKMRKLLVASLHKEEIRNIVEAETGAAAWNALEAAIEKDEPFDIVLSEWNLPELAGIDLLKKLRVHPAIAPTAFVFITAEAESEKVRAALEAQVNGFIVKPFSHTQLMDKLKQLEARSTEDSSTLTPTGSD
jgi:two-component system chemotaxis response regulator CheY